MSTLQTPDKSDASQFISSRYERKICDKFWRGYFIEDHSPDKHYDPEHFCKQWGKCCSDNLKLKPQILIKYEMEDDIFRNHKIALLSSQMAILSKDIKNLIKEEYDSKYELKSIMNMMNTYVWLSHELMRMKFNKEDLIKHSQPDPVQDAARILISL